LRASKRVQISLKQHLPDARGVALVRDIADLGITTVTEVRLADIYWLDGNISDAEVETLCARLLADPVTQDYSRDMAPTAKSSSRNVHEVEVAYNPGVADPVGDTVVKGAGDIGIKGLKGVRTATRYRITGSLSKKELDEICSKLLVNPIIQHVADVANGALPPVVPRYRFNLKHLAIREAEGYRQIKESYGFSQAELSAIRAHYVSLGRDPTDIEIETLAQTWSEHCVHKTFKGEISLGDRTVDNLLKSTIMLATRELNKPWCLSVFDDNAGVIDFDGEQALCFKVETHNHPSALEPYGGAATGIGGVIRDVLGTGKAARPILNTDVFCFAPPDMPYEQVPPGVLHPRRLFKGVHAGVADYGNRMGIPTVNGAVLFDERYVANPLVYCGTLGIMPAGDAKMGRQQPGDKVMLVGGRTGRDGIHGVTFASEQLTDASGGKAFSSVQIGNPIVEKKVVDTLIQARDRGLYRRITDCGGGGLSSAVGEMGEETGVRVDLELVPLKYAGLSYGEIWVSESQERMLLAVPPEHAAELVELFAAENVIATVIGEFTDSKKLELFYRGRQVADMDMDFLHHGLPQIKAAGVWEPVNRPEPEASSFPVIEESLINLLGAWNVCSKEWVIRQYDHEVQGMSVLKPLVGIDSDGPGDAAVVRPLAGSERGVIVGCGVNTRYGDLDPYWMAASVIDEALRQIIAVGGSLERVALLDNFCWGDTADPSNLGALVRSCEACRDMALAYGTPFISGKDSLNNHFRHGNEVISIPHTLLVSALAVIPDVNRAVSMDFKSAGDLVYLVGETFNEMGGSEYYGINGHIGNAVPRVNPETAKRRMDALAGATAAGLVAACHDLSDGGLGVALSEMAFAGGLGVEISLGRVPQGEPLERDDQIMFSESNSRFLVEVEPQHAADFEKIMDGLPAAAIGVVNGSDRLGVIGLNGKKIVGLSIYELKEAWQRPLRW